MFSLAVKTTSSSIRWIPFHKDLGDERLITRGRHDKVDVRRPVGRSFGGSQKLTYGAVSRSRVGGRHERDKLKGAIFIGPETASQIVVRLLLILVLIKSIGRGLPGIENRPLDRGVVPKIEYSSRDPDAHPGSIITGDGSSSVRGKGRWHARMAPPTHSPRAGPAPRD